MNIGHAYPKFSIMIVQISEFNTSNMKVKTAESGFGYSSFPLESVFPEQEKPPQIIESGMKFPIIKDLESAFSFSSLFFSRLQTAIL